MTDLITQSRQWRTEADELLKDSRLVELLEGFGSVKLSGSYSYDLLLGSDLDIYVFTNEPALASVDTLRKLVEQRYWNGYLFYDWVKFRSEKHESFPKSYYVGLKSTFNTHRWKVDIWMVKDNLALHDDSWITDKLTADKQQVILDFKAKREEAKASISSYEIYDAVLNRGLTSFDQLLKSRQQ